MNEATKKFQKDAERIVSQELIDTVEGIVGMGSPAWDMVEPKEIIYASYLVLKKHFKKPLNDPKIFKEITDRSENL